VPGGIYFYRLTALSLDGSGTFTERHKMILNR